MRLGTDMLYEAVSESLKNMLLVMYSVKAFHNQDGLTFSPLWHNSWLCIEKFLPHLKEELFKDNDNPMLHVPINIRDIPSPILTPMEDQKSFINIDPDKEMNVSMSQGPEAVQNFANNIFVGNIEKNEVNIKIAINPCSIIN